MQLLDGTWDSFKINNKVMPMIIMGLQQKIEEENMAYLSYHREIEFTKVKYFPEIMRELPPKPKYDFSDESLPPPGDTMNLLEYVNGDEMQIGIDLRDNEFCILMGKTCTFMEEMIVTQVIHSGKYFYKTQNDFKIKPWYQFW